MSIQFAAVFENGVFRPLHPITLPEQQQVTVTIDLNEGPAQGLQAHFSLSAARWEAFCEALDAPPKDVPALRKLLTERGAFDVAGTAAG